jgi:hypothetical protein
MSRSRREIYLSKVGNASAHNPPPITPDPEYFFTKEWREKEAEGEKDMARGRWCFPSRVTMTL